MRSPWPVPKTDTLLSPDSLDWQLSLANLHNAACWFWSAAFLINAIRLMAKSMQGRWYSRRLDTLHWFAMMGYPLILLVFLSLPLSPAGRATIWLIPGVASLLLENIDTLLAQRSQKILTPRD